MARRTRRPCLICGTLIRTGSYCQTHDPGRSGSEWQTISTIIRRRHVAENGLVCPGLPAIGHADHPVASISELSVHHITPIAFGGTDDDDNLIVVCIEANSKARGRLP